MNIHLLATQNRKGGMPGFLPELERLDSERTVTVKEFGRVVLRPIAPADEKPMIRFHESLSEEGIYLRYFEHISLDTRTLHERLARVCSNSADSYAIVAVRHETSHHPEEILAVSRLTTTEKPESASFALLMSDQAMTTELPEHMLTRLIEIARAQGFKAVEGELLVCDHDTLTLCRKLGFNTRTILEEGFVRVNLAI
jgi:acetyltransferase